MIVDHNLKANIFQIQIQDPVAIQIMNENVKKRCKFVALTMSERNLNNTNKNN